MDLPRTVTLVMTSHLPLVDVAHSAAERMGEFADLEEDEALNLALAVREAVINAVLHGNRNDPDRKVRVDIRCSERTVRATVRDEGSGFSPEETPDPTAEENLMRSSGRGILMMRAFVDDVRFRRTSRGMEVTLIKNRPALARTGSADGQALR